MPTFKGPFIGKGGLTGYNTVEGILPISERYALETIETLYKQFPDLPDHKRKYYPKRHQCQFSWYCDGKADRIYDKKAYAKIYALAIRIISGRYNGLIEGATHYHADYVSPSWSKSHTYIGQIADHIFYR